MFGLERNDYKIDKLQASGIHLFKITRIEFNEQ